MKKITLVLLIIFKGYMGLAQKSADVEGTWMAPDNKTKLEIFSRGGHYYGKVTWLQNPNDARGKPLLDKKNLYPMLRKRPIMDLEVLKNFIRKGSLYEGGTIYDPKSGKTYKGLMIVKGTTLQAAAYLGMFKVQSQIWKKVN